MLSLSDNFRATGRAVPTRNGALITALRRPRMARRRWSIVRRRGSAARRTAKPALGLRQSGGR